MTKHEQNFVALVCHAIVCHRFAEMCNPRYRGSNFSWDDFPESMGELCSAELFTQIENPTDEMKAHARETGEELAERMVQWMTE